MFRAATLFALLLASALPARALELVELKDGRLFQATSVTKEGKNLRIVLDVVDKDKTVEFEVPIDLVVPQVVYYAWLGGIAPGDSGARMELASWARSQGLFDLAAKQYRKAGEEDPSLKAAVAATLKKMYEEHATWDFNEAFRLFNKDEVARARKLATEILDRFPDSKEVLRAKGLLSILAEREAFLTDQKRKEAIARRARRQRREMRDWLGKADQADRVVQAADYARTSNALSRLVWAASVYRAALSRFHDIRPAVEVDSLRKGLDALIRNVKGRLERTLLQLADLSYIAGEVPEALQAVHEVLALSPGNDGAQHLRDRILDAARAAPATTPTVVYPGIVYLRRRLLFPYGARSTYLGIRGCDAYPDPFGH